MAPLTVRLTVPLTVALLGLRLPRLLDLGTMLLAMIAEAEPRRAVVVDAAGLTCLTLGVARPTAFGGAFVAIPRAVEAVGYAEAVGCADGAPRALRGTAAHLTIWIAP